MLPPLSRRALELILSFEGLDQAAFWPGGDSGITIGFGYDLGFVTHREFMADWGGVIPAATLGALLPVVGITGAAAKRLAPSLAGVTIDRAAATAVFEGRSVPHYQKLTEDVFPGVDRLPLDAQGALISLVYNRGTLLMGDSRREMMAIRRAVAVGDLREIVYQILSMKRLWVGKKLKGLLLRRDAEAHLVASCITPQ